MATRRIRVVGVMAMVRYVLWVVDSGLVYVCMHVCMTSGLLVPWDLVPG